MWRGFVRCGVVRTACMILSVTRVFSVSFKENSTLRSFVSRQPGSYLNFTLLLVHDELSVVVDARRCAPLWCTVRSWVMSVSASEGASVHRTLTKVMHKVTAGRQVTLIRLMSGI